MTEQSIKDKYFNLLAAYVARPEESYLLEAADLGRELVLSDVPPEEIAELHEQALERLAREQPDMTLLDAARRISSPLMELLMAYGLAFRERLEERKRAEEALRESEERYRTVVEYQTDLVCRFLPDGVLTFVNQAYCRYHGKQCQELVGHSFMSHILPEERERVVQHLASFSPEKPVATIEHRAVAAGGKVRWQQWINRPIFDEQGNVTEFQAVGRDVTERVRSEEERARAEEALKKSEEKYQDLYDLAPDMFASVDAQTATIIECNQTLATALGYTKEEIIGRPIFDMYAPASARYAKEKVFPVFAKTGEIEGEELQLQRKDRSTIDVSLKVSAVRDAQGNILYSRSIFRDVTARKRAEEGQRKALAAREKALAEALQATHALRESEERLRLVVQNMPVMIDAIDAGGNFVLWNRECERVTGYSADEIVGNPGAMELLYPDSERRERVEGEVEAHVSDFRDFEWDIKCKDGGVRTVSWTNVSNQVPIPGWMQWAVGVDITERIRSEEERKQMEQQLRQQERLAAVGQLAGGIAHDFNNMLTVVNLFAYQILRQEHSPASTVSAAETIIKETKRAAKLVGQILDFSRRSPLDVGPMDLKPFIKEAVRILERTIPESIQLHLDVGAEEEYVVKGDPTRIQQALTNLVVNARDAMPEGGELRIALSRTAAAEKIRCAGCGRVARGEWVQITVTDTGSGIPPDVLPRIFEPFFTTKEVGKGTGLGLAQVYGIVEQHGGHIDVETEPGQGTTFHAYLPASKGKEQVAEEEASAIPQGQGETILLVEDNENLREGGRDLLELLGYHVLTGANGQEALEVCQAVKGTRPEPGRRIDLVITDIVMPKMGGKQLMQELGKAIPALKVLALTGYAMEESQEELKEAGFLDVVYKPFEVDQLARVIRRALDEE